MFKKFLSNKKRTMLLCAVLIFGVMLGVGVKILVTKAALQEIKFEQANGTLNMQQGQITNLLTPPSNSDSSAANVNYVNGVANGTESGVGIWQSTTGDDVYLNNNRPFYNVGIGTTVPGYKLDISDSGSTAMIRIENNNAVREYTGLRFDRDGNAEKWFLGMDSTDDDLIFRRDGSGTPSNDMVIDTSGNVSILGSLNVGADLTVVDAFTIEGVLYAESDIEVGGNVTTNKVQKSDTGPSIEFDANNNVVITIP